MISTLAIERGRNNSRTLQWKGRLLLATGTLLMLAALQYLPIGADGSIGGVGNICPFRNLTHLPCPLCGMTRSLLCFFQGALHTSLRWHPLGPFMAISLIIGFMTTVIPGLNIKNMAARLPRRLFANALIVFIAGCWALRLAGVFPLPLSL